MQQWYYLLLKNQEFKLPEYKTNKMNVAVSRQLFLCSALQ